MRINRARYLALFIALTLILSAGSGWARKRGKGQAVRPARAPVTSVFARARAINPNHPLRRQVRPRALLKATVNLMDDGELSQIPRHVRRALSKLAKKPQRELRKPKVQRAILEKLRARLGDEQFTAAVGGRLASAKKAVQLLDAPPHPRLKADMIRGWGWKLLSDKDRAFSDPSYLANLMRESGQSGAGHMVNAAKTKPEKLFQDAWRRIAPRNTRPVAFALTGSDANNLLYSIALKAARKRLKNNTIDSAEMLVFDSCFGGARGKIASAGFLNMGKYDGPKMEHVKVVSPHSYYFKPNGKKEIRRLEGLEAKALKQIEHKVKTNKKPVGAILIEPIIGAKGVMFYRPEFMSKLRALCDRLGIVVVADEILTGGGRTGKFFAYQHYKGFQPDFVTFGKGLQVAGVATVYRNKGLFLDFDHGQTTLQNYSEPLIKGARVMTRIHDGNLMENAVKVGQHMVRKIKAHDGRLDPNHTPEQDGSHAKGPTRGMGLLVYSNNQYKGVRSAMYRLMPPLTITTQEVDRLFTKKNLDRNPSTATIPPPR